MCCALCTQNCEMKIKGWLLYKEKLLAVDYAIGILFCGSIYGALEVEHIYEEPETCTRTMCLDTCGP